MTSSTEWNPKNSPSRPADVTESIHRAIAWIYGAIGALVMLVFAIAGRLNSDWGATALVATFFFAVAGLHAALAAGARRRSGLAKAGSIVIGVLMLAGFPIGTVVGGFLIYNAAQNWPPRRVDVAAPVGPDLRML
jgi:hypothetical protein